MLPGFIIPAGGQADSSVVNMTAGVRPGDPGNTGFQRFNDTYGTISNEPVSGLTLLTFNHSAGLPDLALSFSGDVVAQVAHFKAVKIDGVRTAINFPWALSGSTTRATIQPFGTLSTPFFTEGQVYAIQFVT